MEEVQIISDETRIKRVIIPDLLLITIPLMSMMVADYVGYFLVGLEFILLLSLMNEDVIKKTLEIDSLLENGQRWQTYDILSDIAFIVVWFATGFWWVAMSYFIYHITKNHIIYKKKQEKQNG